MWQMDALRRLAAGELAEVIGPSALESDRDSRRWRLARIAEAEEHALTPETRQVLAAYARGVNYYMETHRGRMAPEFALLHYDPRPWRIRDSLLVVLEMFRTLTSTWREKINKVHMLQAGDAAKVNFLYPSRTGEEVQPGSNAWVLSGGRSANGKPILANDPHLEWSFPSAWHLVHLRAPDLDVAGAALPGIPCVIIGHNRRIAWGVTNLGFEVQDLYRERIDLSTGRYEYRGAHEQARRERDVIAVKGATPVATDQWITRHGPVFLTEGHQSYSMRWLPAELDAVDFPLLELDRAGNWAEFNAALARFPGPAQNFVYADVDGNIGYHAAGKLPDRGGCKADLPADGSAGECEWKEFIPYEDLPHAFNPASGMIVTANQNPFPAEYRWAVEGRFGPKYRAQEIRARLDAQRRWQPRDMAAIQKDVYSAFGHFLAQEIVAAWDGHPGSSSQAREAVGLLRSWNGQMEKGMAAPLIETLAYNELRRVIAERAAPGHGATYDSSFMAPQIIESLLRARPRDWFSDYDALLVKSLIAGLAEGEKLQGSKVSRWDYGAYQAISINHPIFSRLPLIGKYFSIGPVPMSGSATTIKQNSRRIAPSLRIVIDLSNLDGSFANLTIGESGHPLSRHYKDQWTAYYTGGSFPMEFDKIDAKDILRVRP